MVTKHFLVVTKLLTLARILPTILLFFLFGDLSSVAQGAVNSYTTSLTGSQTFTSLADAEAAMRASSPAATLLQFRNISTQTTTQTVNLYVIFQVEPITGPWDYGYNRCDRPRYGSATEQEAVDAGMLHYYGGCNNPSVADPGFWGTTSNKTRGSCGSSQFYPQHINGIEHVDTRRYRINYCNNLRDGLTIYRQRTVVGCPSNYLPAGNGLICWNPLTATITATSNDESKDRGCQADNVGNPCNPATGNKYQSDMDLQGSITFSRQYNSFQTEDVGLGVGWTSHFHKRLERVRSLITIRQADGRGEPWLKSNDIWSGDPDSNILLTEHSTGFELTYSNGHVDQFDLNGKLLSETTSSGQTTAYGYNVDGLLDTITGPFGHEVSLAYDANNHISTLTDPDGQVYTYSYDANGNLATVQYPDVSLRSYHYEDTRFPNLLTGITDENANRFATFAYDADRKAISTEHTQTDNGAPQEKFTLAYDSSTQTTVTDPINEQWIYTFSENLRSKNLTSKVSQSDGKGITQQFDANNNLISRVDEEGRTTNYTYNAHNQRISMTEAVGTPEERTTIYEYVSDDIDLLTRVESPSVKSGLTQEVVTVYDPNLNISSITQNGFAPDSTVVSRATGFSYNTLGQVTQIDGPRTGVNDFTTLAYYTCTTGGACGQLQSITNALSQTTTYDSYNAHGLVTQITDQVGTIITYGYDTRQRLTSITQTLLVGAPRTTTNTYDGVGQLMTVTRPDGMVLTYTYDAAHDLRTITDNLGNSIEYAYDLKGNRTQVQTKDPDSTLVRIVDTTYDIRNRVNTINAAGSLTQTIRDAVGNLVSQTDPNQNPSTTHSYDPLNRLTQTLDALGNPAGYQYDATNQLTQIQAPNGATTSYEYDDLDNRLKETSPDRGITNYTHDSAGNISTLTDARGITVVYTYDALNRVTLMDYPGTDEDVTLTYDTCPFGMGRLCQTTDQSGVTNYEYDPFGNSTRVIKTELGQTYDTQYVYDAADRIISMTYPDGRVVNYTRDAIGRIADVSTVFVGITTPVTRARTYRADGLLTSQTLGNGLAESRVYDLQGRLTQQTLGNLLNQVYMYDDNGNLLESMNNILQADFTYDSLDRLTDDVSTLGNYSYGYDPNGNRISRKKFRVTIPYSYDPQSNRLLEIKGIAVHLDATGNTLSDRGSKRSFEYNQAGRLTKFYKKGQLKATYVYNTQGQRTRKVKLTKNGSTTFVYHYDLNGNIISEYKDGKPIRDYVWVNSEPVYQVEIKQKRNNRIIVKNHTWFTTDQLSTPRVGTDESQTKVWAWTSTGFGIGKPNKDPDGNGKKRNVQLRFPGQFLDVESGLYYNHHRYYDPSIGRYITSDPIGLVGGLNSYGYVDGNPLHWVDPSGLFSISDPSTWPRIPQSGVNIATGFGDGVSSMLSLGLYNTADFRDSLDIDGGVNECSTSYEYSKYAGYGWGVGTVWAGGLNGGANSVFWSGEGGMAKAAQLGITLEKTPIGAILQWIGSKTPYPVLQAASATFAANARGIAIKAGAKQGYTWRSIEKPILKWRNIPVNNVP